ncbi:MAG: phosphoglycerate kinase [Nitrososphaerales archaeon]
MRNVGRLTLMEMRTLDEMDLKGKTVFVRCDINSPIEPSSGKILDRSRPIEVSQTIKSLKSSKTVIASHQGRLGKSDYVTMEEHAAVISELVGSRVGFIPDVFGPAALGAIKSMHEGDIIMLDNLRFMAEENSEFSPDQAANTHLVRRLRPYLDVCVLDAFSAAHRAHPSIIGFAEVMPTLAGKIVEREVKALTPIVKDRNIKFTAVLGGAKIPDRLSAIKTLLQAGRVERILVGGLFGNACLLAAGKISASSSSITDDRAIAAAKVLLETYPEKFTLPQDVAVDSDGGRLELDFSELKDGQKVLDIGSKSVEEYSRIISESENIFMTGPSGMFEKSGFDFGTNGILKAIASHGGKTITSGGHLSAVLERLNLKDKIYHVSTAGGALVLFLSGKRLPLIEALDSAASRF